MAAICQHFGIDLSELNQPYSNNPWRAAANLTTISGHDYPLVIAAADEEEGDEQEGRFTFTRNIEYLEGYEGDVIILDPFVSIHQCPENNNSMIDAIVKRLGRVASRRHLSIELVHHSRKPAHGGNIEIGAADARGASSFGDGVRSLRTLNRMTEREAKQAKVDNARNFIRLDNVKGNYVAAQESSLWYRHQSIPLPNGDDVGVVLPWHFPGAFDGVTVNHMRSVRNLASSGQYRADPRADEWIGQAVAQVLDLDLEDEGDLKRIKQILKVWIEKGVLQKVERKDSNRQDRLFVEPGETPTDDDETVQLKPSPQKKKSDEFQPVKIGRAPDEIACVQCQTMDERPVWKIRDGRVPYGQAGGKPECLHEDCAEKWFTGQFHS